jgi:hypothetical protein
MPDPRTTEIEKLIANYKAADKDMTEANVEAAFVARLFAILGWVTDDPTVWNRQVFVRGAGFADVGLQIQNKPVLFLEAKRFGKLKGPANAVQAALFGDDVVLSQADRQRAGIDRTPEEKQAMRYARAQGIPWAVLTNFERLVLFEANEERIILAFDAPEEYVSRFDDLKVLAPRSTPEQFDSHLNWYKGLQKKADVDADFFEFLSRWRVRLAQDMFDRDAEREAPLFHPPTSQRLERLMEAVQRTLDRLIILRYADDVGVLLQHDLLENLLAYHHGRLAYVQEYDLQQEVNRLFHDFYRAHNTTIFAPGHVCEQVLISNECLVNLVREISSISFRKFSSDILGNTYESYLGQKLQLVDGQLVPEVRKDVRKGEGIYYTPGYIVRYIVDHTLGRWLYGTENGQPPSPSPQPPPSPDCREREGEEPQAAGVGEGPKTLADLDGLRVLDAAMGSGSFLIYAFDVLADFYEQENARIEAENNAAWEAWAERARKEGMFGKEDELPPPQIQPTEPNYIEKILQEHLYGVDLDPEAVEIAGVNLIMAAFRRLTGNRQPHRKLPLILRQNLKCGNSLISGDKGEGISEEEYNKALVWLIQLRGELRELRDDAARAEKLAQIEAAAAPLNATLNEGLREYFGDDVAGKRPFNWAVEFPEAFDPRLPKEQRGFTVIAGNPPWGRGTLDAEEKRFFKAFSKTDSRHPDTYTLFIEFSLDHSLATGYCGYVVPDTLLLKEYPKTRRLLLDQMALHTLRHAGMSFGEVSLDTVVYTGRKEDDPELRQANVIVVGTHPDLWLEPYLIPQSLFHTLDDFRFNIYLTPKRLALRTRLWKSFARFSQICEAHEGIHTGNIRDKLFVNSRIDDSCKPLIFGREEIGRYLLDWQGKYVRYDPTLIDRSAGEYASLREERIFTQTKLFIRRTGDQILATYDDQRFYASNNLFSLLLKPGYEEYDLRYVLAILNSRLMTGYFRLEVPRVGRLFSELKIIHIDQFPFKKIDFSNPTEKAQHDTLVELAQRMLDLNQAKQKAKRTFSGTLRGYERETESLRRAYWDHAEYRPHLQRQPLLDANATGEVSAVSVDEEPPIQSLLIHAEVDGEWQDVARLVIPDEDLRLFLFFALRHFLHEKRRKKVWARGRVLRGLLEALNVPVLVPASAAANLARIAQLMADFRAQCPPEALHLSELERTLRETDAEIDRRVYDLYGLTEEERRVVEERSDF